jgi:hypothetical protein
MTTDRLPRAPGADRFLIGIVVGAVALIVAGILAVVLVGRGGPSQAFDPSSPAGTVQAYVEAIRAGDRDRAYAMLSRAAQTDTRGQSFRDRFPSPSDSRGRSNRVLIEPIGESGNAAEVRVTVSRFSARSDPFSTGAYHNETVVRLVREDGAWKIDRPIDPYSFGA